MNHKVTVLILCQYGMFLCSGFNLDLYTIEICFVNTFLTVDSRLSEPRLSELSFTLYTYKMLIIYRER